MRVNDLEKANKLREEIKKIDYFIWMASRVWTGKLIKKTQKYIFKSISYGTVESAELELNTELKNKLIDVIQEYKDELDKKFRSI